MTATSEQKQFFPFIIVLAACILRLVAIGENSLWLDESTSLTVASRPLTDIIRGIGFDNHTPPFYYVLLHLWLKIFPANEIGLRSLSVLFDVLNVSLIHCVFTKQYSRRVGLTAAVIYASSPFAIYYAQEGRMYPLVIFLGLASYCAALRFLDRPERGSWQLALAATTVAGLYTHYFYAFFLAGLTAAVLFETRKQPRAFLNWLAPLVLAGICFLPWVKIVLSLAGGPGQTFRQFVLTVPPYAFFRFSAGYAIMPLNYGLKDDMRQTVTAWLPIILPFIAVFALLILAGIRRACSSPRPALFFAALLGPALISFVLAAKTNILSERYWAISYPYFVGALALLPWGAFRPRLWLALQIVASALWVCALASHYQNPAFGFSDWRGAARLASAKPDALVAVRPAFNRDVLRFYLGGERRLLEIPETELIQTTVGKFHSEVAGSSREIVLIETGDLPSIVPELRRSGFEVVSDTLLPFENGIRVTTLRAKAAL